MVTQAEQLEKGGKFKWVPFGAGRHRCIGFGFAQLQIRCIMSTILRQYKLELVSGGWGGGRPAMHGSGFFSRLGVCRPAPGHQLPHHDPHADRAARPLRRASLAPRFPLRSILLFL